MDTLKIVEMDKLGHSLFDPSLTGEAHTVQALCFQRSEEIFHCRVVIRATGTGHRAGDLAVIQNQRKLSNFPYSVLIGEANIISL